LFLQANRNFPIVGPVDLLGLREATCLDSGHGLWIHQPEKDGAVGRINEDENLVGALGIWHVNPVTRGETVGLNLQVPAEMILRPGQL